MKVTGKPVKPSVGMCFIGFAVINAILILRGMKGAASPILYICIFGGLFVGIPAVLGTAIVHEHLHDRTRNRFTRRR
jgi:hypothetical protein